MMKKLYIIRYQPPGVQKTFANVRGIRTRAPLTRSAAIDFINKCESEKWPIKKILFDNKQVHPEHRKGLTEIAMLWRNVDDHEKKIKPRIARLAKLGKE